MAWLPSAPTGLVVSSGQITQGPIHFYGVIKTRTITTTVTEYRAMTYAAAVTKRDADIAAGAKHSLLARQNEAGAYKVTTTTETVSDWAAV